MRNSSSIQGFEVISIFFQNFSAICYCLWILSGLNLRLSCIKSQHFQDLLCFTLILLFNKLDTLLIKTTGLFIFSFFECLISLIFGICGFSDFLLITKFPLFFDFILEIQQLHFEMEDRIWWNLWGRSSFSVGVFRRTDKSCSFTSFHGSKSLIPAFDDSSFTQIKFKGAFSVLAGIELSSVFQSSFIKGEYLLTLFGTLSLTLLMNNFSQLTFNNNNFTFYFLSRLWLCLCGLWLLYRLFVLHLRFELWDNFNLMI